MLLSVFLAPGLEPGWGRSRVGGVVERALYLHWNSWRAALGLGRLVCPGTGTWLAHASLSWTGGLGLLVLVGWLGELGCVLLRWLSCQGGGLRPLFGCVVNGIWIG
ncbi:hypothetical protein ILYODFUR_026792 [Ilyodon furcidens]|uniref:Uncharacterized protein n=1 Tax=Ilyodon furcidens TaxID=33524 RepID=A0ABV0TPJ3_9TELE